jgi:hypothetical protein
MDINNLFNMNNNSFIYFTILLGLCIVLYMFIKNNCKTELNNLELFADFKKQKENEPVCVKPFAITNDKDKVFEALKVLNEKIDEIEFSIKTDNKKYNEMYDWYKQKTDRTSQEALKVQEKTQKELKKNLDKALDNAQSDFKNQNKEQFIKESMKNAPPEGQTVTDLLNSASKIGDPDEKKDVQNATKDLDLPTGYV